VDWANVSHSRHAPQASTWVLRQTHSRAARWSANDALRELTSEKVRHRLASCKECMTAWSDSKPAKDSSPLVRKSTEGSVKMVE
jgi:hypothetical protein